MPDLRAPVRILLTVFCSLLLPFGSSAFALDFPVLVDMELAAGSTDPLGDANAIVVSSDGLNLYVAGRGSDSLTVLDRNPVDAQSRLTRRT